MRLGPVADAPAARTWCRDGSGIGVFVPRDLRTNGNIAPRVRAATSADPAITLMNSRRPIASSLAQDKASYRIKLSLWKRSRETNAIIVCDNAALALAAELTRRGTRPLIIDRQPAGANASAIKMPRRRIRCSFMETRPGRSCTPFPPRPFCRNFSTQIGVSAPRRYCAGVCATSLSFFVSEVSQQL
jgi:hypothetical protein